MRVKVRSRRLGWDALKDAIVALAHAFNLKALYAPGLSPGPDSPRRTACSVSQCCAFLTQRVTYCVWKSRGYFNCLATGESYKLDGLLLPVSVSQIAVFTLRDRGPAARFAVGSADRLLAVYLLQFVRLAAKRLVGKSLQLRKEYAGLLLNSIKHAKSIQLEAKSDFGKGCYTRSTEPYFYEAAYLYVRDSLSL